MLWGTHWFDPNKQRRANCLTFLLVNHSIKNLSVTVQAGAGCVHGSFHVQLISVSAHLSTWNCQKMCDHGPPMVPEAMTPFMLVQWSMWFSLRFMPPPNRHYGTWQVAWVPVCLERKVNIDEGTFFLHQDSAPQSDHWASFLKHSWFPGEMMASAPLTLVFSHQAGYMEETDLTVNTLRLVIRFPAISSVKFWGFTGTMCLHVLKRSVKSLWKAPN